MYPSPSGATPPIAAYPYFPSPSPRRAGVGTILSGMFDVWTKNFQHFFLVFFLVGLLNGLIGGVIGLVIYGTFGPSVGFFPGTPGRVASPTAIGSVVLFTILSLLAGVILNSIVAGGMTEYAVRRFRGESIRLEWALRRGLNRFLSILGAYLLLTLLLVGFFIVPLLLIFLPFSTGTPNASAIAAICGGFLLLAVGGVIALYVGIAMSLYAPAIMMEDANATDGLMRSWRLTKRHWWSLFGAFFVTGILSIVVAAAITLPIGFLRNPVANIFAMALLSGIVGAWSVILAAVAYDLLVRQTSFGPPVYYPGMSPAPPVGAAQAPPPPPAPPTPPGP